MFGGVVTKETENEVAVDEKPNKEDAADDEAEDPQNHLIKMRNSVKEELRYKETVQCLPLYSLLLALGNFRLALKFII